MKKVITLIILLGILNQAYAQKANTSGITHEKIQNSSVAKQKSKKGYQGIIEIGYAMGIGEYGMNNLKLNLINSIRCNPYFSIGLGIGLRIKHDKMEFYENRKWPSLNNRLYPIFLDLRTNFMNKKVSPYLSLGLGGYLGSYGLWSGSRSGFFVNPSAGFKIKISEKSALKFAFYYEMENVVFFNELSTAYTKENVGSLGINIGISF
jgi:hypothetical protein